MNQAKENSLEEKLKPLLAKVQNPQSHKDIVSDGSLISVKEENKKITIELGLPDDRKLQLAIEAQIKTEISKSDLDLDNIKILISKSDSKPQEAQSSTIEPKRINDIKQIIAIASGKGGVGKSTVSANLAFTLAGKGFKVGLLDADIYGPSLGKMVGQNGKKELKIKNEKIQPIQVDNVQVMSFSFLIDEDQAVVWRGPMLGKAIEQFLYDIEWGELDYLIIDLPPGTGDTQLSLAQLVEIDAAIIVTTPQNVALLDAGRAVSMFEQVNIPILGVVENMSEFICPHCNKSSEIFSKGGGSNLAAKTESQLLGKIPLTIELMQASESGINVASKKFAKGEHQKVIRDAFDSIADKVVSILKQT